MKTIGEKILVKVDMEQKGYVEVAGRKFLTTLNFNTNYRERSPILAVVQQDSAKLKAGTMICCHHNRFYEFSPYRIGEDLFGIPYTNSIFFRIDDQGEPHSICGNIICERVPIDYVLETPVSCLKNFTDRVIVVNNGYGYKKGDEVFTIKWADYEVVYTWEDQIHRVIKVLSEDIVAVLPRADRMLPV